MRGRAIKRKRYTDEQIAFALRQAESGTAVAEICRELSVSESTFDRWKKQLARMGRAEIRRLKQIEEENIKLKRLVADLSLGQSHAAGFGSLNRTGEKSGEARAAP
jgi:putative transposase